MTNDERHEVLATVHAELAKPGHPDADQLNKRIAAALLVIADTLVGGGEHADEHAKSHHA